MDGCVSRVADLQGKRRHRVLIMHDSIIHLPTVFKSAIVCATAGRPLRARSNAERHDCPVAYREVSVSAGDCWIWGKAECRRDRLSDALSAEPAQRPAGVSEFGRIPERGPVDRVELVQSARDGGGPALSGPARDVLRTW